MIWLTWRQNRTTWLIIGVLALIALAGSKAVQSLTSGPLDTSVTNPYDDVLAPSQVFALAAPLMIGIFLGAGIFAAEIEHGTHALTLTQSVGRVKWFAAKLGLPVIVAAAAGASLAAAFHLAWSDYLARIDQSILEPLHFDAIGIVPAAYAVFATTTGAVVGLWMRRVLPTIAITLAIYVVVHIALMIIRPTVLPAEHVVSPYSEPLNMPERSYLVDSGFLLVDGRRIPPGTFQTMMNECVAVASAPPGLQPDPVDSCLIARGVADFDNFYYLDSQFWPLQAVEAGLLLGLSAGLTALGVWWTRKRLS